MANGRPPSCHSGPANSSSAGNSACGGWPDSPSSYTFHQPVQSVAAYSVVSFFQSGASTDSRRLPISSRPPATPPSSAATRSSVPSQGMCGWFQEIQASRVPSGDGVGKARKSGPETITRTRPASVAAEPSSGTATMARLTRPPSWRSRTHQTSLASGDSVKSAYRSAPAASVPPPSAGTVAGSGVSGWGSALPSAVSRPARYSRWSSKWANTIARLLRRPRPGALAGSGTGR